MLKYGEIKNELIKKVILGRLETSEDFKISKNQN